MGVERRTSPRFACELATDLQVGNELLAVTTVDLSFSGICVVSPQAVATRQEVGLRLRLLFDAGGTDDLLLLGETVWCTAVRGGYQVGCRFLPEMPGGTWRRLDLVLQLVRGDLAIC